MPALSIKHVRRWTSSLARFVLLGCFFLEGCGIFHASYDYLAVETPIAISKKGESAVVEYDLPKKQMYIFVIRFRAAYNGVDNFRLSRLNDTRGYNFYTKESVENGHPEQVPRTSPDSVTNIQNLYHGVSSGKYVRLPADTSGQIPVHIVVSSLDNDGVVQAVSVDKDVNTNGYFVYGSCRTGKGEKWELCMDREIVKVILPPGRYRVQVATLDDISRFAGVDARIAITHYHK